MPVLRDTLAAAPAELVAELGSELPRATRVRTRLAKQLAIHQTGDISFDKIFITSGGEVEAFSVLDAETRHLLLRIAQNLRPAPRRSSTDRDRGVAAGEHTYVRIGDGRLAVRCARPLEDRVEVVRTDVTELIERLSRPIDFAQRLHDNVVDDPIQLVRIRSLNLLLERFPGHERTVAAARLGSTELPVPVQIVAAAALGEEGRLRLRELSENTLLRDEVRRDALARYLALGASPEVFEVSLRIAASTEGPLQRLAAGAAGAAVTEAGATALIDLLRVSAPAAVDAAARGLATNRDPVAARVLLALLPLGAREATIDALAERGTIDAVAALDDAARTGPTEQRRRARAAITAIQSRAVGAPGALSITGPAGGELSLPTGAEGALSVAEES